MKRNIIDVIRRGFDNAVANWPLLLFRFAETIVALFIIIGSIIVVIVPMIVSAGMSHFNPEDAGSAAEAVLSFVAQHVAIIAWVIVLLTAVSFVIVAVHSFVMAGAARVLVDADRAAGDAPASRDRYRLFTVDRFLDGGKRGWWPVFWIYNIAYFVAFLIVCLPILLFLAIAILVATSTPALITVGCFGAAVTVMFMLVTGIVTAVWAQKAIVVQSSRALGGMDSLRHAWRDMRVDFVRHFAVAIVMMVIGFAISSAVTTMSLMFSPPMPHQIDALVGMMFLPARIATTSVSSVLSSALAIWWTASFAAMEDE
jgi:hypothetical protein